VRIGKLPLSEKRVESSERQGERWGEMRSLMAWQQVVIARWLQQSIK